jgi:hypothetical protein
MTTGERHIDYEALAQDAIRGIVRTVLGRVAKSGLPGQHHFYIAFDTTMPGVSLSPRLKAKYPQEMTIVLQHRFRDLAVNDKQFEVELSFDGVPERLVVPFSAVKVFFDPSVPYGLQFEGGEAITDSMNELGAEAEAPGNGARPPRPRKVEATAEGAQKKPRSPRKPRGAKNQAGAPARPAALTVVDPSAAAPSHSATARPTLVTPATNQPANDTKIIQLDKFRKK